MYIGLHIVSCLPERELISNILRHYNQDGVSEILGIGNTAMYIVTVEIIVYPLVFCVVQPEPSARW